MSVAASGASPTLSYVLTMAARGSSAPTAPSTDPGANGPSGNLAAGATTATAPASGGAGAAAQGTASTPSSRNDAILKQIRFLEDPTSVTYERRTIRPGAGRPMTPAELARTQADLAAQRAFQAKYPTPAVDPNAPVYVRDLSAYPPDTLPMHYMMMRSIILNRQAAGLSTTVIEGREGQAVDATEYLDRMKQAAIASLRAQISVDKSA